jgi:hypothetical protein
MSSAKKIVRLNQPFTNNFMAILAMLGLFVILGVQSLPAQTGRANISGTVTDSQGAVVSGATVTATNTATGVATPTTTNGAGAFSILQLIPGNYNVRVEKEGFGAQEKANVTLTAEQNLGADFALQPGKVSEKVTVEAGAELVHTESAELSETINEHSITELPLNGRNPASLVLLTPGTTDVLGTTVGQHQSYTTFPTEGGASTNGGRQGSTLYLLDGAYNMDNYHLLAAPFPNPDATQEFSVIGNNFDPRYGFTPGGVVSIVTKSGTNNWHGDAFDFLRNGALNAKDYFTKQTDNIKRNQFGGSLGGPIVKDKFFVFGNYQGTRQTRQVLTGSGYVPTTAMRAGDFSAFCQSGFTNGLCNDRNPNPNNPSDPFVNDQIWIADPNGNSGTTHTVSQAQANPALYYPGNIICQTAAGCAAPYAVTPFNPASVTLVNFMPTNTLNALGLVPAIGYGNINNFNEETIRGDYNLNDHNRISGRAFLNFFNQPAFSKSFLQSDRSWIAHWQNYSGTWTWTISPHVVNNLTGSFNRLYDHSNSGLTAGGKPICYSQLIKVSEPNTPCSIEDLSISGGYGAGSVPINAQNFNEINRWTYGFSDSLSISKGKHLIVAGVDVLRQYWFENTDWLGLPLVDFSGGNQGYFTGSGFADFLLGDLGHFEQGGGESNAIHAWMVAPYVADQIKVRPNFTLSVGLRWEPWIAPVTASGRIAVYNPGQQSTRYPNAPVGMVFPGDSGVPSAGTPSDYWRFFDPRVGLAWQPKALPNTSIRAAFGMFATPIDYANWNHAADTAPFSPTYTFSASTIINNQAVGIIPFSDPWSAYSPTGGVSPFPPFPNPGTSPSSSTTAGFQKPVSIPDGFDLNYTDGRTYTWNLSLEHQFGSNWLAKAAYVASESDHQSLAWDHNYGQYFGPGNPLNGTPLDPVNFAEVLTVGSPGTANYESGQFTIERRFSHGLQFTGNYTYSKTIDWYSTATTAFTSGIFNPRCLRCNRSNSSLDVPHTFVANFVYETPTLSTWNAPTRLLLGGWEISGIYRAQSGNTFWITSGQNTSFDNRGQDNPDYASGYDHVVTSYSNFKVAHSSGGVGQFLNPANFTLAPLGTKGNIGRNPLGAFGPWYNNWDLGMMKNFRFTERYRLQFRWEMFNAFNRTTFDYNNLDTNATSNTFGQFFGTNGNFPARVMEAALKFSF